MMVEAFNKGSTSGNQAGGSSTSENEGYYQCPQCPTKIFGKGDSFSAQIAGIRIRWVSVEGADYNLEAHEILQWLGKYGSFKTLKLKMKTLFSTKTEIDFVCCT